MYKILCTKFEAVASAAMAAAGGPSLCQLGIHHGWTACGRGDRHGSRGGQLGRLWRPQPKQHLEASVGPKSCVRAELSSATP